MLDISQISIFGRKNRRSAEGSRPSVALSIYFSGGICSAVMREVARHGYRFCNFQKQIRPLNLYSRRDTTRHPVLNTLNPAARFVIFEQSSHLRRATKFLDEFFVGLNLLCIVHSQH